MPKIRAFEVEVAGTPAEVAARLRERSRWRLMPHTSSILGRGGLGGRVGDAGFALSLDPPPRFGNPTRMLPVARARLEPAGPGRTRIVGQCGMPPALVWYLRLVWLTLPVVAAGVIGSAVASGETGLALAAVVTAAAVGGATVGIGINVAASDDHVDEVADAVLAAAGAPTPARIAPAVGQTEG